jgi:plastocyanin
LVAGVACSDNTRDSVEEAAEDVADEAGDAADKAEAAAKEAADRAEDVANDENVNIDNFAYEPKSLEVTRGQEVTWVNQDDVPHTVTADDGGFESEQLGEGDEFTERFLEDGTFAYHCEVHGKDRMSGKITVTNE